MKIIYTDVLVVGAGLAGLRMAVAAKRHHHLVAGAAQAFSLEGRSRWYASFFG